MFGDGLDATPLELSPGLISPSPAGDDSATESIPSTCNLADASSSQRKHLDLIGELSVDIGEAYTTDPDEVEFERHFFKFRKNEQGGSNVESSAGVVDGKHKSKSKGRTSRKSGGKRQRKSSALRGSKRKRRNPLPSVSKPLKLRKMPTEKRWPSRKAKELMEDHHGRGRLLIPKPHLMALKNNASLGPALRLARLLTGNFHNFARFEWFYGTIDVAYFSEDPFGSMLSQMAVDGDAKMNKRKLTRSEWSVLRRSMGKPRRFGPSFIEEKMSELSRYRERRRIERIVEGKDGDLIGTNVHAIHPFT